MSPDPDDPEPVRIQDVPFAYSADRWVANTARQLSIYRARGDPGVEIHLRTSRCVALSVGSCRRNHS